MSVEAFSAHELRWLGCREKSCCSTYSVMPTGADLWRISRSLELQVWEFTRFADAEPGGAGSFALDADGPRFQVVLARRAADGPCLFLLRLPDGHAQCALGKLRPTVCEAYPAVLDGGKARVGDHAGCTCGPWTQASLDDADELERLRRLERERREHYEMVAEWNAFVAADPDHRDYPEFCDFLINLCERRYGGLGA